MSAKMRVGLGGFDPMLVRGYLKTGFRAVWWYLPDEVHEEYKVKIGDKISGRLLKVYGWDGKVEAEPNEPFEWETTKETSLSILMTPEWINKYELTAWKFLELVIEKIRDEEVYPGEERVTTKMWPIERMGKVHPYHLEYIAPID